MFSMGQEFGNSFAGCFWLREAGGVVSPEVIVKVSAGTAVIGGLDWGRRLCFQGGPLTELASRLWQWVGGVGSSAPAAALMAAGFPQRKCLRGGRKLQCCMT